MRVFRITVSAIIGILFSFFLLFSSESRARIAILEPVNEAYYNLLKEEALNVAKTMNKNAVGTVSNENVEADIQFSEEELRITIESSKAEIVAKIPISKYTLNIENEKIIFGGTAEFEKIEYIEKNKLDPASWYILEAISVGMLLSIVVNYFISELYSKYKK